MSGLKSKSWCVLGSCINPVGAGYSVTSCDLRILMYQPTESIPSLNASGRQDNR
jgi:hypothetical protein